jgi:ferredoxin-NADP reductase
LLRLAPNDELILHDVFGTIVYKTEGTFIAGGAGVTPFVSIFRYLKAKNQLGNNKLIFANKTKADIILEKEFKELLGGKFINILSDEKCDGYAYGYMDEAFLKANLDLNNKPVYLCGPPPMMEAVEKYLNNLHVDEKLVIKEAF